MQDAEYNWSDRQPERRSEPRFDQRLDQWVTAGRQLVDGVSGARPGSRSGGRAAGLRLDHLGRWVEDKLDWLMEDEEGWRETWEEPAPRRSRRQPLEAISRRLPERQERPRPAVQPVSDAAQQDWPDDDSFSLNRWSRSDTRRRPEPEPRGPQPPVDAPLRDVSPRAGRALPRSSRRRFD